MLVGAVASPAAAILGALAFLYAKKGFSLASTDALAFLQSKQGGTFAGTVTLLDFASGRTLHKRLQAHRPVHTVC